jgi:hypothetical protein
MKNNFMQTSLLRSMACDLKRIVASRIEWNRREFHTNFGAEKLKIKGALDRYVIRQHGCKRNRMEGCLLD